MITLEKEGKKLKCFIEAKKRKKDILLHCIFNDWEGVTDPTSRVYV